MKLLLIALLPLFVTTGLIELFVSLRKRPGTYGVADTFANIGLFFGSQAIGLGASLVHLPLFLFLYAHRMHSMEASALTFALLALGDDFAFYWYHRMSHEVRVLWTSHEPHHSSEKYNLSVAGRQPWTAWAFGWVFWAPLVLVGMKPEWIVLVQSMNLAYQYFLHTRLVGKLGPLEWVLNTPSHHRVHHGTEPEYLDRNYGGVLIIWDRLFGTFQEEGAEPRYGISKPLLSNNPLVIVVHAWSELARDVLNAKTWSDRFRYVFGRPGWRHDGTGQTAKDVRRAWTLAAARDT